MSNLSKTIAILGVVAGLGVAALPLSSYAAGPETKDVGVTLTVDDVLTISADKDNASNKVDLSGTGHTGSTDITVTSNNSKGYTLAIKGSATNGQPGNLTSTTVTTDAIIPGTGTFAAPAVLDNTANSQWGYSYSRAEGSAALADGFTIPDFTGNKYIGVSATGDTIENTKAPTADAGEVTTVDFAAVLKDGQAAGTYEGQVTFTATNNA